MDAKDYFGAAGGAEDAGACGGAEAAATGGGAEAAEPRGGAAAAGAGGGAIPRRVGGAAVGAGAGGEAAAAGGGAEAAEPRGGAVVAGAGGGAVPRRTGGGAVPRRTGGGAVPRRTGGGAVPRRTGGEAEAAAAGGETEVAGADGGAEAVGADGGAEGAGAGGDAEEAGAWGGAEAEAEEAGAWGGAPVPGVCGFPPAPAVHYAGPSLELVENFYIVGKRKSSVKVQVKLNSVGVYLRRETLQEHHINEQLIDMADVIGSQCGQRIKKPSAVGGGIGACKRNTDEKTDLCVDDDPDEKDKSAYLYIYAYVKHERPLRRRRTVRILRFRTHDSYRDNLTIAERWHRAIAQFKGTTYHVADDDDQFSDAGSVEMSTEPLLTQVPERKPLLILLNPKSGSGKARELFQNQVVPVLSEAEVPYELRVTTHANYARELIRTHADLLDSFAGVVVASGDGLFFEVLNGMMARPDWQLMCRRLPLGIIPCGSGNGLAKSIAHAHDEPYEPKPILNATLTCIAGHTALMDIVRVEIARGAQHSLMYSFLSVGWGLIADIDIESERLRSIGAPRFTLWSIRRLINLRTYRGKVYYLLSDFKPSSKPSATSTPNSSPAPPPPPRVRSMEPLFRNARGDEDDDTDEFDSDIDEDPFEDIVSVSDRNSQYSSRLDSWRSAASQVTAYYSVGGQSVRNSTSASIQAKIESANAALGAAAPAPPAARDGPAARAPPLGMPLTTAGGWRCEEGDFVMVHAAYTTHLASDCFFAPESRLNDGIIYLIIVRAGIGRTQLAQFLLGMSSGSHLPTGPDELISVLPVSAFRIEPRPGTDGIMTVDGERVDYGNVQGEILQGMVNVMVPNQNRKADGPA